MELETINKLYLELSQIATAKTAREIELEGHSQNEDVANVLHLLMYDRDMGWAKISSGLDQDFESGFNSFNVRFKDGTEHRISFKVSEL